MLGVLRTCKALMEITEDASVFNAATQDERLRLAYVAFTKECKKLRISALLASPERCAPVLTSYEPEGAVARFGACTLADSTLVQCRVKEAALPTGQGELSNVGTKAFQCF